MKITYSKVLIAAAGLSMASCAVHDLIPEIAEVGQAVPTVYWEVGSTSCKAGESFTFKGKYTVEPGRTPLRSEVWYQILRSDVASASVALAGTTLSYTQTVTSLDTMRSYQCHASYPHSEEYWNGHEYIVNGEVPTSRTLVPVRWSDAAEFDWVRFNSYYPDGFVTDFLNKIYGYLTDPATANSYYNALRTVYLKYNFTNEQFKAVGLPEIDLSAEDGGSAAKSDAWYRTESMDASKIVGYYYITIDANGETVYNEVPLDYQAVDGQVIYPVYDACKWVFCRYDDNTGGILTTVRPEWLPKFRTLIENIPFIDWIYDSANAVYKIEFKRDYKLESNFRAYDTDGVREYEGKVSATDQKTIELN